MAFKERAAALKHELEAEKQRAAKVDHTGTRKGGWRQPSRSTSLAWHRCHPVVCESQAYRLSACPLFLQAKEEAEVMYSERLRVELQAQVGAA